MPSAFASLSVASSGRKAQGEAVGFQPESYHEFCAYHPHVRFWFRKSSLIINCDDLDLYAQLTATGRIAEAALLFKNEENPQGGGGKK